MSSFRNRLRAALRILRGNTYPSFFWVGSGGNITSKDLTPIVYACSRLRATLLASLPLRLYRVRNGKREAVTDGKLYDLLRRVNPFWTTSQLIEATEWSLCLYGEAFWIVESANNTPSEIWLVNPETVRPIPDSRQYIAGFEYLPQPTRVLTRNEVVWFRYHNPFDEYAALSPYKIAENVVKLTNYAIESNTQLFEKGIQMSGFVVPRDISLSAEQARMLEEKITERFSGLDKAHRWGVLTFAADVKSVGFSPREAEFLGILRWATEEICRIYGIPIDLIAGTRSYQNYEVAVRLVWQQTIMPEARFIADVLTEFVSPIFSGEAYEITFDFSGVAELQESESARWERAQGQIEAGVLTINEFRQSLGLEPTSWGDNWWIPSDLVAIENTNKGQKRQRSVPIPFGSPEHQRIDREFARQVGRHEPTLTFVIMRFFDIIAEEVKRRLRDNLQLAVEDPFDLMSAIPRLRDEITPPLLNAVLDILQQETASLNISRNVLRQRALEFISNRSQRFAQRVSETTWHRLRDSLRKGMELGEGIPKLEERVLAVIADRIRSTPETIARTEVVGALNGGKLLAWLENGDIAGKRWIATLDNRTRDSHREVHGLVVELLDNFIVGAGSGPAPGQIGLAEEDINCRCTIVPVFRWEMT